MTGFDLRALPPRIRGEAALGVLDVTEWYGETSGGIRTYLDEKAAYVSARDELRHVVVVPGERDAVDDEPGVRRYRLRGPRIPRHRPYRFMLATRSLAHIVRHERPDVIEVGSPFVVPWIIAPVSRRMDVPIVCFHHTNVSGLIDRTLHGAPRIGGFAGRATRAYLRRLNDLAAITIVASRSARGELEAAGVTRIVDIPLGVDTERFTPTLRANASDIRRQWKLPDAPLVGYLGRFAAEKSLSLVLDAWAEVERVSGARLVLIGTGPEEEQLRAHPYASRVHFLPFQTDRAQVARLVAALDVMVAPSPVETFGLAALEALACGTPVLTADRGGVAEQVQASGAGLAFESERVDALIAAAIALLGQDHAVLAARGRIFAERHHAWPIVLDRLFTVYRDVVRT
ncbi:MAG: glycosyltransferase [Gemmatimonadaceae bacterium]|nr:glycosyltransferase [Gemmatimonadaceae bacterium]